MTSKSPPGAPTVSRRSPSPGTTVARGTTATSAVMPADVASVTAAAIGSMSARSGSGQTSAVAVSGTANATSPRTPNTRHTAAVATSGTASRSGRRA